MASGIEAPAPVESGADPIDARVVKALAHPTRVRILDVLHSRELVSPVELADELKLPLGTVGYHVRRLEALGFLELAKRTQRRGAIEHHYRACEALEFPAPSSGRPRRSSMGAQASAIMLEAQAAVGRGAFDGTAARTDRRVLALDTPGRDELAAAFARWLAALERIERASARRIAKAAESATGGVVVAMVFDVS